MKQMLYSPYGEFKVEGPVDDIYHIGDFPLDVRADMKESANVRALAELGRAFVVKSAEAGIYTQYPRDLRAYLLGNLGVNLGHLDSLEIMDKALDAETEAWAQLDRDWEAEQ